METERQILRRVDELFRADKTRQFTYEEIAGGIGIAVSQLTPILDSAIRCPRGLCQSYDAEFIEGMDDGFELRHCNRCNKNFHTQRGADGYEYVGVYLED